MHKMTPKCYTGTYLTPLQEHMLELVIHNGGTWMYGTDGLKAASSEWRSLLKRELVLKKAHPTLFGRVQYHITRKGLITLQGVRAAQSQGSTPSA